MKKIRKGTVKAILLVALLYVVLYALSWILSCGLIYLICLGFGWAFKWGAATSIWLIMCILKKMLAKTVKVDK